MHQKNISVNQERSFATLLSSTYVMESIIPNFFKIIFQLNRQYKRIINSGKILNHRFSAG